jgi:glycosyltransferase involved in cell wall biosynthesis
MKMCWENLDLLISCAPTESYGRAAREALFFGVPVLATPSSGINSLTEANQLGYLEYFESYFESQHLAEAFDRLLKKTISLDFRKRIASNDEENFNSIIEEWIVLANFISKN